MSQRFEYGMARIKDVTVQTEMDRTGKSVVSRVLIDGRPAQPTKRFWNSLHLRFGFTENIFKYFSHKEVFSRISSVSPNDEIRWCRERDPKEGDKLLAVTGPTSPLIRYEDLMGLLKDSGAEETAYSEGQVRSRHSPRCEGTFKIAGDDFRNKFVIETPIDGFGKPSVYLMLLRLICTNGAIGFNPAFRSELGAGKGIEGIPFVLQRAIEGFNNEDGYIAMRERFEAATQSWASLREVNGLYRILTRLHHGGGVNAFLGNDGAAEVPVGTPLFRAFHKMTGDLAQSYGLANLDAVSAKRQRTLPAACKVYDLLNFASEVATHHSNPSAGRMLQTYIGDLISIEYDLEGTAEHFGDWKDFFIEGDQGGKKAKGTRAKRG